MASSARSTIYLLRHAESVHNVTKDFSIRDPGLTELGKTQAAALRSTFPALDSIGLIVSSPLTRTIETTLAAFGDIIDKGEKTKLVFEPYLQERSDLPCDTGSELSVLEEKFIGLSGFDKNILGDGWWVKEGANAADDASVAKRAAEVRKKLLGYASELEKKEKGNGEKKTDIVVVTHGVFMKFLAEDEEIDLPKAGWKAYTVEERNGEGEKGEAVLVAV
ncbi:histidine phosphatase superfamily [Cladorrhinum sp. PSN259]|nr:histidine phosphatase superfamily [Cladorrhinum sp. PSN259]